MGSFGDLQRILDGEDDAPMPPPSPLDPAVQTQPVVPAPPLMPPQAQAPSPDIARARAALQAAQQKADRDSYTSRVGASLDDAGAIIRGDHNRATPASAALTDRPVQNILTGRAQDAEEETAVARKAAQDPDSDVSKRATMLAVATGLIPPGTKITAAEFSNAHQGGQVSASREEARGKLAQADAALKQQAADALMAHNDRQGEQGIQMFAHKTSAQEASDRLAEERRYHDMEMAKAAAAAAEKDAAKGKVPAEEAAKLSKLDAAQKALDDLEKLHGEKASDVFSGVSQYLPGSDAAEYKRAMLPYAENIKAAFQDRENPAAAQQVDSMLPTPGLPNEAAKAQFGHMRELIANRRAAIRSGVQAAGYKLGAGVGRTVISTTPSKDGKHIRLNYSDGTSEVQNGG